MKIERYEKLREFPESTIKCAELRHGVGNMCSNTLLQLAKGK